ncbi:MAG: D-alanyl-D-alanine carboxypeptidase/D-alanyl-D-alanine-endopeptidase [Betaproteobacteria bacterium]|nr:D-alanyl-D-alanine carboxypeptidase/D-alanyl-D-alanine-endopeptidase [Betaproteobacteria bacterium]
MRYTQFLVLVMISGSTAAAPAAGQDALPAPVAAALRTAGVPASNVAIVVQQVGSDRPSTRHQASTPMNPASTMKLVTAYAALEMLGPAYRWKTEAHVRGSLQDEVLAGDLVFKGYGDPKLTYENLWLLLRALRERGLRDIRGDVLLDRSYFDTPEHDSGKFDDQPLRPYNVGPDALLLNFKAIRFQFVPEPERSAVRVYGEPRLDPFDIVSVLRLTSGPCGDWQERIAPDFRDAPAPRALFTGSYPASCGERSWHVALLSPDDYFAGVFRRLWSELGGALSGGVKNGALPKDARLLASVESPGLAEVVRDMNKFSNNVMARQLYLTLGAEASGPPANAVKSRDAVKAWLARKGIDAPELEIENGSGLSRVERISAGNLAALLVAGFRSPLMPELLASLPLVAVDGTMRRRLRYEGVAGQAHIKTGTLADARAIAGYVLDRRGSRHAVVMFVNHPNAPAAQGATDALLRWVYDSAAR